MTGLRFGRLVGVAFDHRSASGHAHWLFQCDCGKEVIAAGGNVRSGSTASCGCLHREICAARLTRHGYRAAKRHGPTYRAWQEMRLRGAGNLCPAWQEDFTAFLSAMGERPVRTKLARYNPDIAFQPGNCLWKRVEDRSTRAAHGWARRRSVVDAATSALV